MEYMVEIKIRPYIGKKLKFLHGLYGGIYFSKIFCPILSNINGSSIFVSIPHCYYTRYSTLLQAKPCSINKKKQKQNKNKNNNKRKKRQNRVEYSSP